MASKSKEKENALDQFSAGAFLSSSFSTIIQDYPDKSKATTWIRNRKSGANLSCRSR